MPLDVTVSPPSLLGAHSAAPIAMAFRPDGRVLASSSAVGQRIKSRLGKGAEVKLWDIDQGRELCTLRGHRDTVSALAFSPDGHHLLTGSQDGTIGVWDVTPGLFDELIGTRVHTIREIEAPACSIVFHPTGNGVVIGDSAGGLHLLNTRTWRVERRLAGGAAVCKAAFSPDGSLLAAIWRCPGPVRLWECEKWTEQQSLLLRREEDRDDLALAFSKDNELAVLSIDECRVWDLSLRQISFSFESEGLKSMTYIASPKALFFGGWASNGSICGWLRHGTTGAVLAQMQSSGRPTTVVAASPVEALIATGHADSSISLWSVTTKVSTPAAAENS